MASSRDTANSSVLSVRIRNKQTKANKQKCFLGVGLAQHSTHDSAILTPSAQHQYMDHKSYSLNPDHNEIFSLLSQAQCRQNLHCTRQNFCYLIHTWLGEKHWTIGKFKFLYSSPHLTLIGSTILSDMMYNKTIGSFM